MTKSEYREGTAGWWLLQWGWKEVPHRGRRPRHLFPLWSKGEWTCECYEAIEIERGRIALEFSKRRVRNNEPGTSEREAGQDTEPLER